MSPGLPAEPQTLALVYGIPLVADRPGRSRKRPEVLLGDKDYDSNLNWEELRKRRILPVISPKGSPNIKGMGKLRYVVEQDLKNHIHFLIDLQQLATTHVRYGVLVFPSFAQKFLRECKVIVGQVKSEVRAPDPFPVGDDVIAAKDAVVGSENVPNCPHEHDEFVPGPQVSCDVGFIDRWVLSDEVTNASRRRAGLCGPQLLVETEDFHAAAFVYSI